MANLLLDTELNNKQRRQASVLLSSSESLLQIINDILDLSKLESGKLQVQEESFKLCSLLDNVLNSFAITSQQKNIELLNLIDKNIPVKLIGDPLRLRQVLINLLGNALKFTEEGHIILDITLDKSNDESMNLNFHIRDTGIGMTKKNLLKLFKPFSQIADYKQKRGIQQGTGLGLSISQKLAELMGGAISVDSKVNEGSTFTLTLPLITNKKSEGADIDKPLLNKNLTFYQPLKSIANIVKQQLNNISEQVVNAETLNSFIKHTSNSNNSSDVFILDSENLDENEIIVLLDHLTNNNIKNKQWLFIQSINGKHDDLESYCEKHHVKTIIKPTCQFTLYETIRNLSKEHVDDVAPINEVKIDYTGKNILLVEDNKVNQMVAKALLKKQGIEVTIANDGLEAIDAYQQESFDVVLMDIDRKSVV